MSIVDSFVNEGRLPTMEEMTNLYLYGQREKPKDMLDTSTWAANDNSLVTDGKIAVAIDYNVFMQQTARFFDASSFDFIRIFMGLDEDYTSTAPSGGLEIDVTYKEYRGVKEQSLTASEIFNSVEPDANGDRTFTKAQLLKMYDLLNNNNGIEMKQWEYDVDSADYLERSYIWASQSFMVNPAAKFVIKADGTREIQDFSIVHRHLEQELRDGKIQLRLDNDDNVIFEAGYEEDYDFQGSWKSNIANTALEPVIDPSGIGHKVEFKFIGLPATSDITAEDFWNLYVDNRYTADSSIDNLLNLADKGQDVIWGLFHKGDRPTAFLDANGKPIIYSGDKGSFINGTSTGYRPASWPGHIDIADDFFNVKLGILPIPTIGLENHLSYYVKNGVTYVGGKGIDRIQGTEGNDILYGHGGSDCLFGGGGHDEIHGGAEDDIIYGEGGNDKLYGGTGLNHLDGGEGDDEYHIGEGLDIIKDSGKDGALIWHETDKDGALVGQGVQLKYLRRVLGTINQYIDERSIKYALIDGHLFIYKPTGGVMARIDDFSFTDNNYGLILENDEVVDPADILKEVMPGTNPGGGGDVYHTITSMASKEGQYVGIISGSKHDLFTGGSGNEVVDMGAGNDIANGGLGHDVLDGGEGNDVLLGSGFTTSEVLSDKDNDRLTGGEGRDLIFGGIGSDTIICGTSQDELGDSEGQGDWAVGGTGNDFIFGSKDDDFLNGGAGADVIKGGNGDDIILGDGNLIFGYKVKSQQGLFTSTHTWNGNTASWNHMHGTTFANYVDENSFNWSASISEGDRPDFVLNTEVALRAESERLAEGGGNDIIFGGAGKDWIAGQTGDDYIDGGEGDDVIYGDDIQARADDGNDLIYGGDGNDRIFGGGGHDTIYADFSTAAEHAAMKKDTEDRLYGGSGNDTLFAGKGNDQLHGEGDDDKLHSSAFGSHLLNGGTGRNSYFFDAATMSSTGHDTIVDEEGLWSIFLNGRDLKSYVLHASGGSGSQTWQEAGGAFTLSITGDNVIIKYYDGSQAGKTITITNGAKHQAFQDLDLPNEPTEPSNSAPEVTGSLSDQTIKAGQLLSFDLGTGIFIDPDGDQLTYRAALADGKGLPAWLNFDSKTGQFSGTPPLSLGGQQLVLQVWASDGQGESLPVSAIINIETAPGYNYIEGTDGDDSLTGSSGADHIEGFGGNDTLHGGNNNDYLYGGNGDDKLYGGAGNDVLDGGAGNDYLEGGDGNDVFVFGKGYGHETVNAYDKASDHYDVIRLTGLTQDQVSFGTALRTENGVIYQDLVITIKSSGETLTVLRGADSDSAYRVQAIEFGNGQMVDYYHGIMRWLLEGGNNDDIMYVKTPEGGHINGGGGNDEIHGGNGDDFLIGGAGHDRLFGNGGNDSLYGGDGNDYLSGGAGDFDTLIGGAGDDILDGGAGADYLDGGAGNDVYIHNLGGGHDIISNYDEGADHRDIIRFGENIAPEDLLFYRTPNNESGHDDLLIVNQNDPGSRLTIINHFADGGLWAINGLEFADGSSWSAADIAARLENFSESVPAGAIEGTPGHDELTGTSGDDFIYGYDGNDILDGRAGNDYLSGGAGNDIFVFGVGYGHDTVNAYDINNNRCDKIKLLGLTSDQVSFNTVLRSEAGQTYQDLIIRINATGETLTLLRGADSDPTYWVQQIEFGDGTNWDYRFTVLPWLLTGTDGDDVMHVKTDFGSYLNGGKGHDVLYGGVSDDTLIGDQGNDALYGQSGNDYLYGGDGNDYLYGGAGADYLYGQNGNDILEGGAGNDHLEGNAGDDTYIFKAGDGQDIINNYGGGDDCLKFAELNPADLWFKQDGQNLLIGLVSTNDHVTVSNWYQNNNFMIDRIEAGGLALVESQVAQLVQAMASIGAPGAANGGWTDEQREALVPVLSTYWQPRV